MSRCKEKRALESLQLMSEQDQDTDGTIQNHVDNFSAWNELGHPEFNRYLVSRNRDTSKPKSERAKNKPLKSRLSLIMPTLENSLQFYQRIILEKDQYKVRFVRSIAKINPKINPTSKGSNSQPIEKVETTQRIPKMLSLTDECYQQNSAYQKLQKIKLTYSEVSHTSNPCSNSKPTSQALFERACKYFTINKPRQQPRPLRRDNSQQSSKSLLPSLHGSECKRYYNPVRGQLHPNQIHKLSNNRTLIE